MSTRRTGAAAGAVFLAATVVLAGSGTAGAADDSGSTYRWPTAQELGYDNSGSPGSHAKVIAHEPRVIDHSIGMRVVPVETTDTDGDETVVTLSSDILFDPSDASLPKAAKAKIADLVADVPDGASVKVQGHTDTVDSDAFNQKLSEQRAKAVAGAVRGARDDLELDVEGFGETRLKAPETGDEAAVAEARAENRRVEIRYGG